jgi:hypothetical protein
MDMTELISNLKDLASLLIGNSSISLLVQYGILVADTAILIYAIIAGAGPQVVVLSHLRIWLGILVVNAANLAMYHAFLFVWSKIGENILLGIVFFILVLLLGLSLWRVPIQALAYVAAGKFCLKDLQRDVNDPHNRNWPLIPRCADKAIELLLVLGIIAFGIMRSVAQ